MNRKQYVVGFLFNEDRSRVVLIRKERPDWQKGRFNGLGGAIEKEESPLSAMRREFEEEAGLFIKDWEEVAYIVGPTVDVIFFRSFGDHTKVKHYEESLTDEEVFLWNSVNLPMDMVWPSQWIIGLCLDDKIRFPVRVDYKTDGE